MNGQTPQAPLQPNQLPKRDDDFEAASKAMADEYEDYSSHGASYMAPVHALRNAMIALLVVVLVAGGGVAAWWFLIHNKKNQPKPTTTSQQKTTAKAVITSTTKHYTATEFTLEFDYPQDWKITEATGSGRLTAVSPTLKLKDANGQSVDGQLVLTIRNKQQPLPEFDKGNAVAARASEKITYTKPSGTQRGSTYLSFLSYASTTASNALDGIYITGDTGYQAGQAIPKADFVPVDPIIDVSFNKCTDTACTAVTPLSVQPGFWDDASLAGPVKAMLQSFTIN